MKNITSEDFKANLYFYLNKVFEKDESITINCKNGNCVLIDEKEYKFLIKAINLQNNKLMIKKIKEGEKENVSLMEEYNPREGF